MYPTSVEDEYFYTAGSSQLLVDVGNNSVASPTFHTLDEYVWLGGRPVLVIRGRTSLSYVRSADGTTACGRNGGSERCDTYFPVSDEAGRVVLMLDGSRRVAGIGEYDVYGMVNKSMVVAETRHPYDAGLDLTLLAMQQPRPGLALNIRAHFARLDTEDQSDGGHTDYAELQDPSTLSRLAGPFEGTSVAFWTGWVAPDAGTVNVKFKSDTPSCCYGSCGVYTCGKAGLSVDRWEYRKYQTAATWFWVPLRLAGQYADEETELHENWNRYYEPWTGRYLSPEPLLGSAEYVVLKAKFGASVSTYAYASNNPVARLDPNGLGDFVISPGLAKDPDVIAIQASMAAEVKGSIADYVIQEGSAEGGWGMTRGSNPDGKPTITTTIDTSKSGMSVGEVASHEGLGHARDALKEILRTGKAPTSNKGWKVILESSESNSRACGAGRTYRKKKGLDPIVHIQKCGDCALIRAQEGIPSLP